MTTFNELGLSNQVLKAIKKLGFEKPTDIQAAAIPLLLEAERDLIGLAQTGTGKTAAFGLPLIELVDENSPFVQGLILAPTRELGQQIADQLDQYSKFCKKINVLAVYGGASISNQIHALNRPTQIIIATPGRLLDLIRRKAVNLEMLEFLILDEADEMVNMGFKEELDNILKHTPEGKLTWLFSATMPAEIKRIVNTYMTDPLEVSVNQQDQVNTNIIHQYVATENGIKKEALMRFLDLDPEMHSVVFCRTRRDTQELADALSAKKYNAEALHGDLSQAQRDKVMKRFKTHQINILVATDVAARGIDVNDLTHVFHFSLPDEVAYYTHRSGRTARAGKSGKSIALVNSRERKKIGYIGKDLNIEFEQVLIPDSEVIRHNRIEKWCMEVLSKHPKGKLDPEIVAKVQMIFASLSKEELLNKLVLKELDQLNLGDLNQQADTYKKAQHRHREERSGRNRSRNRGKGRRDNNRRQPKAHRKGRSSRNRN